MMHISNQLQLKYPEFSGLSKHSRIRVWKLQIEFAWVCTLLGKDTEAEMILATQLGYKKWESIEVIHRFYHDSLICTQLRDFVEAVISENDAIFKKPTADELMDAIRQKLYIPVYVYNEPVPDGMEVTLATYQTPSMTDDRFLSVSFLKLSREELGVVRVPPDSTPFTIESALKDYAVAHRTNRYHTSFKDIRRILNRLIP